MKKLLILFMFPVLFFGQGISTNYFNSNLTNAKEVIINSSSFKAPSNHTMIKYLPYCHEQIYGSCLAHSLANCRTILYARDNNLSDIHEISLESFSPHYTYFGLSRPGSQIIEVRENTFWKKFDAESNITVLQDIKNLSEGLETDLLKINEIGFYKIINFEYPNLYPFTDSIIQYSPDLKEYYQYGKNYAFDSVFKITIENLEATEKRKEKLKEIYADTNKEFENFEEKLKIWNTPNTINDEENIIDKIKYMIFKDIPAMASFCPFHSKLINMGNNQESVFKLDEEKKCIDYSCSEMTKNLDGFCSKCLSKYIGGGKVFFSLLSKDRVTPWDAHAVTLIGYNDTINNGSFLILNSWGEKWGDRGMIWIPYKYFIKYCRELIFYNTNNYGRPKDFEQQNILLDSKKVAVLKTNFDKELSLNDLDFNWQCNFPILNKLGNFESDSLRENTIFTGDNSVVFKGLIKYDNQYQGTLILPNKKYITSNWINEFKKPKQYKSTYYHSGYTLYEGDFLDDEFHGKGVYFYENILKRGEKGDTNYIGDFKNGKMSGRGIMYDWDDSHSKIYEGQFLNNEFNGHGTLYFYESNKIKYEGSFLNGMFHGKGELFYNSGNLKYKGDFKNGKFHGTGILFKESREIDFEGKFIDDSPEDKF